MAEDWNKEQVGKEYCWSCMSDLKAKTAADGRIMSTCKYFAE